MENKLNIAELLKDCPKGMELDCTMFDNVKFISVEVDNKQICIRTGDIYRYLTKFGTWTFDENAKCVIFPKGKDTWEGFQRPAKDGDAVVCEEQKMITQMFVVQSEHKEGRGKCYFGYDFENNDFFKEGIWEWDRLATEEERQKLFDAIRAKGYRWNAETKTLEKLITPKFKVGDKIKDKNNFIYTVLSIEDWGYIIDDLHRTGIAFDDQDNYELVPDKFDINTLNPFDKVLVRTETFTPTWTIDFYDGYRPNKGGSFTPYAVTGGKYFQQCIPYEENKHLLGKTDNCDEYYKTWE